MTSPPKQGGPSRRRSSANQRSSPTNGTANAPTPVQLSVPPPRWSLTSRIKERDIWGLGLSSDLPVDESALFAPATQQANGRPDATSTLSRRVGAIRLTSDTDVRPTNGTSSSSAPVHPLQGKVSPTFGQGNGNGLEVLGDVSRPALRRLTSDMERKAGEGLSRRGSATGSRKGKEKAEVEVEVLIHQVMPNETVAGIALLYGIDLSTLRKANKLWPSDPAHLRKHLYVPLEACRWDRAKGSGGISLVRGPGEGQVTLVEKGAFIAATGNREAGNRSAGDGSDFQRPDEPLIDVEDNGEASVSSSRSEASMSAWKMPIPEPSPVQWSGWEDGPVPLADTANSDSGNADGAALLSAASLDDPWTGMSVSSELSTARSTHSPWASESPVSSNGHVDTAEVAETRVAETSKQPPPGSRVLDVVRIPASQLRFFPATKPTPGSSRTSFDSSGTASRPSLQITRPDMASSAAPTFSGPSIANDMHFPDAPGPNVGGIAPKARSKSTMVRLRPPTSGELPPTSFANRISNYFAIPPPPPGMGSGVALPAPSAFARNSRRSARHASLDASNVLSPADGRMSLDSARSAYSALSGRSGGSSRSVNGGMSSRSGSLRALGLSGLDSLGAAKGGESNEVEMQRRGSEDTLKPMLGVNDTGPVAPVRLSSVRRGKKLD